jgi:hypothetical protein
MPCVPAQRERARNGVNGPTVITASPGSRRLPPASGLYDVHGVWAVLQRSCASRSSATWSRLGTVL